MKTMKGSIFGKRLKVIQEAENPFDTVVVCPHCGRHTRYGDTSMISGVVNCPKCQDQCIKEVMHDKEHDYERYKSHDYEPYGVSMEELKNE